MSDTEDAPGLRWDTLLSTDADAPVEAAMTDRLTAAAVVGLGEATHGTHELRTLRHALVRQLVRDHGHRAVALETGVATAHPLDDYVHSGVGTAHAALVDLTEWYWATEGMAALLEWLRGFNEGRPENDRVRVYGIDVEDPAIPAAVIDSQLPTVEPALHGRVADRLSTLRERGLPLTGAVEDHDLITMADELAADVLAALAPDAPPASATATVRRCCRSIRGTCDWLRSGGADAGFDTDAVGRREAVMAANVARCREHHDGTILWAHNGHVQRGRFDIPGPWETVRTTGARLDDQLGRAYAPVGTDVVRGAVRATDGSDPPTRRAFRHDDPPPGSLTAVLSPLERPACVLDLVAAATDPRSSDWLASPRRVRNVLATVDPTTDGEDRWLETTLPEAFDALLAVRTGSPARLLEE